MFIPRQLKRKQQATASGSNDGPASRLQDPQNENHRAVKKLRSESDGRPKARLNGRNTATSLSSTYYEQVVCGLELLLSEHSFCHGESAQWLRERSRTIDGQGGYIHLSSILEHPLFSKTKPALTQKALQQALLGGSRSKVVELSLDEYHVHRRSLPAPTDGIDWDARTVYVEPHLSTLCGNAPQLVHHLLKHSIDLPESLLPVQRIETRHRAWALITFSDSIRDKDVGMGTKGTSSDQRQGKGWKWPKDWIVLTKGEHARRDAEYASLIPTHRHPTLSTPAKNQQRKNEPAKVQKSASASRPGQLISLSNLPSDTDASTIRSFVAYNVDRHRRKAFQQGTSEPTTSSSCSSSFRSSSFSSTSFTSSSATTTTTSSSSSSSSSSFSPAEASRKMFRKENIENRHDKEQPTMEEQHHMTSSASPFSASDSPSADNLKISYVDHKPGSSTAVIRLCQREDAASVVHALNARKRGMTSGSDRRGRHVDVAVPAAAAAAAAVKPTVVADPAEKMRMGMRMGKGKGDKAEAQTEARIGKRNRKKKSGRRRRGTRDQRVEPSLRQVVAALVNGKEETVT